MRGFLLFVKVTLPVVELVIEFEFWLLIELFVEFWLLIELFVAFELFEFLIDFFFEFGLGFLIEILVEIFEFGLSIELLVELIELDELLLLLILPLLLLLVASDVADDDEVDSLDVGPILRQLLVSEYCLIVLAWWTIVGCIAGDTADRGADTETAAAAVTAGCWTLNVLLPWCAVIIEDDLCGNWWL